MIPFPVWAAVKEQILYRDSFGIGLKYCEVLQINTVAQSPLEYNLLDTEYVE